MTGALGGELVAGAAGVAALDRQRRLRGTRVDVGLVAAVCLGAALRLWGLSRQSFWYDEWLTTRAIDDGWRQVLPNVADAEGLPPPYFVFMWVWSQLFGLGEVALRFPSAVAGIATIPVAYAAARELRLPVSTARLAALVVAVHPMLVWYSQEARTYSFLALSGALSLWALARVRNDGGTTSYLLWGLASAAVVASHYYGIFLVTAGATMLLAMRPTSWRLWLIGCAPAAATALLLAPVALRQRSNDPGAWIHDFPFSDRLQEAGTSALVGPNPLDGNAWLPIGVIVLAAGLLFAARSSSDHRAAAGLAAGLGAGAIALAFLADAFGINPFLSRYVAAALVPVIVAVSAAATTIRLRGLAIAGTAVIAGVMVFTVAVGTTDPGLQKPQWQEVAEVANGGSERRLLVMNRYGTLGSPLLGYFDQGGALSPDETVEVDQIDVLLGKGSDRPCNFLVGRACSLVFLGSPLPDGLSDNFELQDRMELDQFTVERYRSPAPVEVTSADLVASDEVDSALIVVPERLVGPEPVD